MKGPFYEQKDLSNPATQLHYGSSPSKFTVKYLMAKFFMAWILLHKPNQEFTGCRMKRSLHWGKCHSGVILLKPATC